MEGIDQSMLALSVVLPVYNEEGCIEEVVRELDGVLGGMSEVSEVVLVDDGSSDGTLTILRDLEHGLNRVRVVELGRNSGQSAAMLAGFREARASVVVTLDSDGQNDPADIPLFLAGLEGYDCCLGYRPERKDSWSKRMGSQLANKVRRAILDDDSIDSGCSLKAFRKELVTEIPPFDGVHRFLPAFFKMQGARVNQVATNHRVRMEGESKYSNFGRLLKTVPDLVAMRWLASRWQGGGN